ncbi:L-fucose mutarotase [Microbacterium sp. W4I4]|uniref:RbsD/FucU domain-containing protein n=1 Tax=Microbacterium sp. W4I4 TaxID=3042295 RepID=UPI0027844582|nr:RbsD/FucU domain-containing protein [Microbacterium sp. W4I4]MDQ0615357.1 L-fucose mutarotase [Microbacterium sp. W4I4]
MLKGIDPRLSPNLLRDLATTGHLDSVLLVDSNFPILRVNCPVHYVPLTATEVLRMILGVLPVETEAPDAISVRSDATLDTSRSIVREFEPDFRDFVKPEPFDFLGEAVRASVAIVSADTFPACYLIRRGVVTLPV